ncbi:DUF927 domain-containing protein [Streptomyces sp. NPDC058677]|uniref:DUF927 domain-containing protein n=1 Tax=Streptomyces sp. NPDC058677 TaxID=3346594 RepID=UPI0036631171
MTPKSPQPQESTSDSAPQSRGATISNLDREGAPVGAHPIAGLRAGWYFRPADRMILHRSQRDAPALAVGMVPVILGRITYRMSDRRHTKIAYQIQTDEGPRIVSAEEVLDGTWADKAGRDRPVTGDERHAYARVMSEEVRAAGEIPALPVKDSEGGLVLPDVDAQELGYLRTSEPDQVAARKGWRRVLTLATQSPRTTLGMSAMFCGPLVSSLHGVPAHILNLTGSGQIGKSTTQKIMCALMGDPDQDTYELMGSMNNTGLFLPELLIEARYLPMCREETSSSALSLPELEKLFQRIVAGGKRGRLGQGGNRKQGAGTWHSIFVTSSNESLLRQGQVESLASRLIQLQAPFFANAAASAEAWDLAARFHGWPLVWARDAGMFTSEGVKVWRELHTEVVARLTTEEAREAGGIPLTLARILGAWCVGAYMLGEVLGMPELGARAEEDARGELPRILGDVTETHLTPGQVLWEKVAGAIAQEPAAFVSSHALDPESWRALEYKPRRVLGYYHSDRLYLYVSTLTEIVKAAGIDTPVPGLKELQKRGVLVCQEKTKLASKHATRELRDAVPGRAYILDTKAAQEAFADREMPPQVTPDTTPVPADDSLTAASEKRAMDAATAGPTPDSDTTTSRAHDVTKVSVPPKPTVPPAIPYPQPEERVSDKAFAHLVAAAKDRTLSATRFGVLGADDSGQGWLHLPNCEPVTVPMPGNVDQVPALMGAYRLKTLWVHESAALAMGLPTYEERSSDLAAYKGPQGPTPHRWAMPTTSDLVVQGEGLSCWMTLKATGDRLSLVLPLYEDRYDRSDEERRGGWGGAASADVLLDSLMVYLVATQHGPAARPKVIPYYLSANTTAKDYARSAPGDIVSEAIRNRAVPPVHQMPPILDMQWSRPADQISATERAALWLHQYDKNAAWLAAFGGAKLGIGEPVHHPDGTPYDAELAAYWRVAEVPGHGLDRLPGFRILEAEEGGFWLRTPAVDLLRETYADQGWEPDVIEAWVWPDTKRALYGMYERIRVARERIIAAQDQGRPGARYAKQVVGSLYQSFRGYLSRVDGPQKDKATGGLYAGDIYWRPDWAAMILDLALANTYRDLKKFAAEDRYALSLKVDAVTLASNEADIEAASPASMVLGTKGGQWKGEGSAPLPELLDAIDNGTPVPNALNAYLDDQTKEA